MGNSLCKERIDRAENSKSPVDRMIGRCVQICPNSIGNKNKSTYWQKHVLETSPPTNSQPKSSTLTSSSKIDNVWRSATLTTVSVNQPKVHSIISMDNNKSVAPIAPPRKKRNTLPLPKDMRPLGGFKEVFGTRRSSVDSICLEKTASPEKRRNSCADVNSDEFSDFSKDSKGEIKTGIKRKISKVGNKKSDKFFGENLSDCLSDSPFLASTPILAKKDGDLSTPTIVPADHIDAFIENNVPVHDLRNNIEKIVADKLISPEERIIVRKEVTQKMATAGSDTKTAFDNSAPPPAVSIENHPSNFESHNNSLDKKAEFLMAMLEGYEKNEGVIKDESKEQIVAPRRKHGRHICDDGEKLRHALEKNEKKIEQKTRQSEAKTLEDIEKYIQKVDKKKLKVDIKPVETSIEKSSLTALDQSSPNYESMQPVEEPLIVPKRKHYKHICHDDDHMHNSMHGQIHFDEVDSKDKTNEAIAIVAESPSAQESPRKPDRDFARYRKSLDLSVSTDDEAYNIKEQKEVERPTRKKGRSISRDSLPTPPPRPVRSSEPGPKSIPQSDDVRHSPIALREKYKPKSFYGHHMLSDVQRIDTNPETFQNKFNNDKLEHVLKKCNSSSSFLTQDLMDQIVHKVYGFKMNYDDPDCMHHGGYDDSSGQVAPTSKLATRKISVVRKEMEKPIKEEVEESPTSIKPVFSIGNSDLPSNKSDSSHPSQKPTAPVKNSEEKRHKTSTSSTSFSIGGGDEEMNDILDINCVRNDAASETKTKSHDQPIPPVKKSSHHKKRQAKIDTENFLNMERRFSSEKLETKKPIDSDKNMIRRTDTVLEFQSKEAKPNGDSNKGEPNSVSTVSSLLASNENLTDILSQTKLKSDDISHALDDIYQNDKSIINDFQNFLEDKKIDERMMIIANNTEASFLSEEKDAKPNNFPDNISVASINVEIAESSADESSCNEACDGPVNNRLSVIMNEPRRGSIVEHDQWFLKHRDLSDQPRRGSECISYDTRTLFPFGKREKTYSESGDFFNNNLSKSSDQIYDHPDSDVELDHSSLLKFFDKSKKIEN